MGSPPKSRLHLRGMTRHKRPTGSESRRDSNRAWTTLRGCDEALRWDGQVSQQSTRFIASALRTPLRRVLSRLWARPNGVRWQRAASSSRAEPVSARARLASAANSSSRAPGWTGGEQPCGALCSGAADQSPPSACERSIDVSSSGVPRMFESLDNSGTLTC